LKKLKKGAKMKDDLSFGQHVQALRKEKGWSVKQFIDEIGDMSKRGQKISAPYITRIEVHGEIPTPEIIIRIAEVLGCNEEEMLEMARENKVSKISQSLEEKYKHAYGLYRKDRGDKK